MAALGFLLAGFGIFAIWSGLYKVNVIDVIRTILGAPVQARDQYGKPK